MSSRFPGGRQGILAGMTTHNTEDHRAASLEALEAATIARALVANEYGKPTSERDWDLIGELRAAAKHNLAEAQVHATLYAGQAPHVVLTVDNLGDLRHCSEWIARRARQAAEASE